MYKKFLEQNNNETKNDMNFASSLLELQFYHPASNYTVDITHDVLEGIAFFEVFHSRQAEHLFTTIS